MAQIKIFTTKLCPYCVAAKNLLKKKDAKFEEIDVTFSPSVRRDMSKMAGGATSVPQIFIGDTHVGGCDDLMELDQQGALDAMLQSA